MSLPLLMGLFELQGDGEGEGSRMAGLRAKGQVAKRGRVFRRVRVWPQGKKRGQCRRRMRGEEEK